MERDDTTRAIDLNADIGEGFGPYRIEGEVDLLRHATSANVACGFHAGDPGTMKRTVRLCLELGVAIGAHPGFPDRVGFGRRELHMAPDDVYDMVLYQIGALQAFVRAEGGTLHHVKPHGSLYNMSAKDESLASAIAAAVRSADESLFLVGLSGSRLIAAGKKAGLRVLREAFADRGYMPDGTLAPRSLPGALLASPEAISEQAVGLARDGVVYALDGTRIRLEVDTICLHGDGPHGADAAARLRASLAAAGINVRAAMR